MNTFIHPNALCESKDIGKGTRIWAFAHILPGARIGAECNICDQVFIENNVTVGDRVTVKCGVQLWDGIRLRDDVFIGPNATFTNDRYPRSLQHLSEHPETIVEAGASIGANATILPGLVIGSKAMVGAGAVVTRNVPPGAIIVGNPGRIIGYEGAKETLTYRPEDSRSSEAKIVSSDVLGVKLHNIPQYRDIRGSLSAVEFQRDLPFNPERYFLVYAVPGKDVRGEHAHKVCGQFLVCVSGSVHVVADDGENRQEFVLNSPGVGLYLPPMIWGIQYKYSDNAVLLVLASHAYDADDYVRDYDEFLQLVDASKSTR
jgi:acetyltransferase-like isoleucine patch superfamily enzyme/dTDP-4-dehydrorhamnose 3,5-epimerase-like enzyme